jgi:hypothetical protein
MQMSSRFEERDYDGAESLAEKDGEGAFDFGGKVRVLIAWSESPGSS